MKRAQASIVSVQTYVSQKGEAFWRVGTGFIYDADGFVVTRRSVIQGGDSIVVTLTDGRYGRAWVVYDDESTGTALLKLPFEDLIPVLWGKTAKLPLESPVTILGNSLGVFPSVTMATYMGVGLDGVLKLKAAIPPGNCGRPVLDLEGRVVGMLLGRETTPEGRGEERPESGVALPIERVRQEADGLLRQMKKGRGWIGISVSDLRGKDAEGGVRVMALAPGGPSSLAEIAVGDTIVGFEGRRVRRVGELVRWVSDLSPDREVVFTIRKGNREIHRTVRVAEQPWSMKREDIDSY